jgi:beta-1,4-N-acetylglucosaminyltransferase
MIFVTVGSTDFDALIRSMDEIGARLGEELIMQIGSGQYIPQSATRYFRYAPSLDESYDQAEIVVSHGGLGTVVEALRHGKKLVAVSNPDRYDTHQGDILGAFAETGYLIWCRDLGHLEDDLKRVRVTDLAPYEEPPCEIHQVIREFLTHRSRRTR